MSHKRLTIQEDLLKMLRNLFADTWHHTGKGIELDHEAVTTVWDHPIRRPKVSPGRPVITLHIPEERAAEWGSVMENDSRVFTLVISATVFNAEWVNKFETKGNKFLGDVGVLLEDALLAPDPPVEHINYISFEGYEFRFLDEPGEDDVENGQWTFSVYYSVPKGHSATH